MERKENLYEPVINFREQRPQIMVTAIEHDSLYEKAFFTEENNSQTDYALNTTTWD